MSRRRAEQRAGTAGLALARLDAPLPAELGGYVDLTLLGRSLNGLAWMPRQLAAGRSRPISPRLPHAIVLHVARELRDQRSAGGAAAVVVDPARLGALTAATADVVAAVLDALRGDGMLQSSGQAPDGVTLAARLAGPLPRAGSLHWSRIADATIGSPSAWVLAHHLATLLDRDSWTPVSRKELEESLGCGTSGLRAALDRLVAGDVIARREQRGGVSVYRFGDALRGNGAGNQPTVPNVAPAVAPVARQAASSAAPLIADQGVWLQIGGVDLDVPAGMRLVVTRAPDGRPRIAIAP